VPFSVFGHYALWLWMVSAVAISLAGSIFAGRIAYRVVNVDGRYRYAAIGAAMFAGAGIYGIQDNINGTLNSYMHYVLSAQSDPMIVTFVLAAIDLHLRRHRRWAISMLVLASLGRPETWPFLGLYCLWSWRTAPETRVFIVVSLLVVAFLWFGVPTITNGRPFVAGDLAERSPRELHQNKLIGTVDRYKTLNLWPIWVFALAAVGWAAYRWRSARSKLGDAATSLEQRTARNNQLLVLALAGAIVVWLVVEVAFALHGWPAVPRYIFEPAVVAVLLAGIGFGWVLRELPRALKAPAWTGVVVAAGLSLALVPGALSRIRNEHKDLRHERIRTAQIAQLAGIISRVGGRQAVLRCGRPVTNVEFVSILGWMTQLNDGLVGHRPQFELHQHYPVVLFTQLPDGWATYPWHTKASRLSACQSVKALYVVNKAHPGGLLVRNSVAPKAVPPIPDTPTPG
jgi:hypothetical protein